MMVKGVVLLSGGLDSTLAACILKDQGVELEAVNFKTMFGCCKDDARGVAHELGIPFTLINVANDYLNMIEKPKHGYGKGINPCVDCRAYMFHLGKDLMEKTGASFLVSGEVLGQRPMSQKRRDFDVIEKDTGLERKILRPLSAKRLPETFVEKEGHVDRSKLYGIQGRSRRTLLELAHHYGIENPPDPSTGCALTNPVFAKKVRDIFNHCKDKEYTRWHFEILKTGRHLRLDEETKIILGRNEEENAYLSYLHPQDTVLMTTENVRGPAALIVGRFDQEILDRTASIILRYAPKPLPEVCQIQWERNGESGIVESSKPADEKDCEKLLITNS